METNNKLPLKLYNRFHANIIILIVIFSTGIHLDQSIHIIEKE